LFEPVNAEGVTMPEGPKEEERQGDAVSANNKPQPSNSTILGAAAEHYVMCQLLRRQMIAALAPAGVPDADIIVSDRIGSTLAAIQVKARRNIGTDRGWHMKEKHETMVRTLLFYSFVDFGKAVMDAPKCWVVPSKIVASILALSHKTWLARPGVNGRRHNPTVMRRFLPDYSHLELQNYQEGWLGPYLEAWHLIVESTPG
jgi:hypothetical protein